MSEELSGEEFEEEEAEEEGEEATENASEAESGVAKPAGARLSDAGRAPAVGAPAANAAAATVALAADVAATTATAAAATATPGASEGELEEEGQEEDVVTPIIVPNRPTNAAPATVAVPENRPSLGGTAGAGTGAAAGETTSGTAQVNAALSGVPGTTADVPGLAATTLSADDEHLLEEEGPQDLSVPSRDASEVASPTIGTDDANPTAVGTDGTNPAARNPADAPASAAMTEAPGQDVPLGAAATSSGTLGAVLGAVTGSSGFSEVGNRASRVSIQEGTRGVAAEASVVTGSQQMERGQLGSQKIAGSKQLGGRQQLGSQKLATRLINMGGATRMSGVQGVMSAGMQGVRTGGLVGFKDGDDTLQNHNFMMGAHPSNVSAMDTPMMMGGPAVGAHVVGEPVNVTEHRVRRSFDSVPTSEGEVLLFDQLLSVLKEVTTTHTYVDTLKLMETEFRRQNEGDLDYDLRKQRILKMLSHRVMSTPHSLLSKEQVDDLTALQERYDRDIHAARADVIRQQAAKRTAEQRATRMLLQLNKQKEKEEYLAQEREAFAKKAETILSKRAESPVTIENVSEILKATHPSAASAKVVELLASETAEDREQLKLLLIKFHEHETELADLRAQLAKKKGTPKKTPAQAKAKVEATKAEENRKAKLDTTSGYSPVRRNGRNHILDENEIQTYKLEEFRMPRSDIENPTLRRMPVKYMEAANAHLLDNPLFSTYVEKSRPDPPADFDDLALIPGLLESKNPAEAIFPPPYTHKLAQMGAKEFAPYLKNHKGKKDAITGKLVNMSSKSMSRSTAGPEEEHLPSYMRSTKARSQKKKVDASSTLSGTDASVQYPQKYLKKPMGPPSAFADRVWPSSSEFIMVELFRRLPEADTTERLMLLNDLDTGDRLAIKHDLAEVLRSHLGMQTVSTDSEFRCLLELPIRFAFINALKGMSNLQEALQNRLYITAPHSWIKILENNGSLDRNALDTFLTYLRDYAELLLLSLSGQTLLTKNNQISAEDFGRICRIYIREWLKMHTLGQEELPPVPPLREVDVCATFSLQVETTTTKMNVALFEEVVNWAIGKKYNAMNKGSEGGSRVAFVDDSQSQTQSSGQGNASQPTSSVSSRGAANVPEVPQNTTVVPPTRTGCASAGIASAPRGSALNSENSNTSPVLDAGVIGEKVGAKTGPLDPARGAATNVAATRGIMPSAPSQTTLTPAQATPMPTKSALKIETAPNQGQVTPDTLGASVVESNTKMNSNPWLQLVKEFSEATEIETEMAMVFKKLDKNRNGTLELSEINEGILDVFKADIPAPGKPGGELSAEVFGLAFNDAANGASALDSKTLINFLYYLVDFSQLYTLLFAGGSKVQVSNLQNITQSEFNNCLPEIKKWGGENMESLSIESPETTFSYFEEAKKSTGSRVSDLTFCGMCHWAITTAKDQDEIEGEEEGSPEGVSLNATVQSKTGGIAGGVVGGRAAGLAGGASDAAMSGLVATGSGRPRKIAAAVAGAIDTPSASGVTDTPSVSAATAPAETATVEPKASAAEITSAMVGGKAKAAAKPAPAATEEFENREAREEEFEEEEA